MGSVKLSKKIWRDPAYFFAFGFGSGLMPIAPGTWGTLMAIPLYLLLVRHSLIVYLFITVSAFGLGVFVSDKVSRELKVHDYSGIVCDEIVGYLLTMMGVPFSVMSIGMGFLFFRLFDIWKPYPIRVVDKKVQGGLGIMLDDVLAAIPAWCCTQLLTFCR